VDLFFVLSGFLVSGLLFSEYARHGNMSPWRFYVRRGLKIYPAFYVFLAFTVTVHALDGRPPRGRAAVELCFLQSYLPAHWCHTWSLAVEEHFYLALPLLLLYLVGRGARGPFARLPLCVGCVCLALLAARTLNAVLREYSEETHVFPTHLRLDSLLFGVLIAYFWHFHADRFRAVLYPWRRWLMIAGVLLFTPAFIFELDSTPFIYTAGLSLFYLGGGALLVGTLLSAVPVNWITRFLGFLGTHSYSTYLWHIPVLLWGIPFLEARMGGRLPFGVRAPLYIAGSFVAGIIMAKLVEYPALALRERLFPSRSKGLVPASPAGVSSVS
jgi:peptidoglycan/LPS O-acetylase OafA/YrhL